MPRGYDSYLMDGLCQSESDGEPVTSISEVTPARRPSLSDALPKIPIRLEGCGVSVSLKAGPHVRWHKVLDKWKACFPDPVSAPMAWPVVIQFNGEDIPITSIQESISRSVGPERLVSIADEDAPLIVRIGKGATPADPIEDVQPPEPIHQEKPAQEQKPVYQPAEDIEEAPAVPKETASFPVKVLIESEIGQKKLKLNVSSNCQVSRLIRKWTEAAKIKIDPAMFEFVHADGNVLDTACQLGEALGISEHSHPDRVVLVGRLISAHQSPAKKPKKARKEEVKTPPTAAPSSSLKEQEAELEYWTQIRAAGIPTDSLEDEWEDDDEALAIALSLSELHN